MKKVVLFLCVILSMCGVKSQKLSITELMNMADNRRYEQVESSLTQKGWTFYSSQSGSESDGTSYQRVTFAYDVDRYDDRAVAWLSLYVYDGKISKLNYQMSISAYLPTIRAQIPNAGFKVAGEKFNNKTQILKYENATYYLTFENYCGEDHNRYNFELSRKGSPADMRNGHRVKSSYPWRYDYTLKDGMIHGAYKVYHSGNLRVSANYVQGKLSGKYQEYDRAGNLIYNGTITKGKFTGTVALQEQNREGCEKLTMDLTVSQASYSYHLSSIWVEKGDRPIQTLNINLDNSKGTVTCLTEGTDFQTVRTGTFTNGAFTGSMKIYDGDALIVSGQEVNDKTEGEVKTFFPNGKLKRVCQFRDDEQEGAITEWFENGVIKQDGVIHQGAFTGVERIQTFYRRVKDEKVISTQDAYIESHYVNDTLHGLYCFYTESGDTLVKGVFKMGYGVVESPTYDTAHNLIAMEYISQNNNHEKHGKYRKLSYDTHGQLIEVTEENYLNGKRNGEVARWSADTLQIVHFVDDVIEGKVNIFSSPDTICREDYKTMQWSKELEAGYHNGVPHGPAWVKYTDSDTYRYVTKSYNEGILHGEYVVYVSDTDDFEHASKRLSFYYQDGKPHGAYYEYDENGNAQLTRKFSHGKLTYLDHDFHVEGDDVNIEQRIKCEGDLANRDRSWRFTATSYYNDSIVECEYLFPPYNPWELSILLTASQNYCEDTYNEFLIHFLANKKHFKHGKFIRKTIGGKPLMEGQYVQNEQSGDWTFYEYPQQLKRVVHYEKGVSSRPEMFYTLSGAPYSGEYQTEKGTLLQISAIKNGLRHGITKYIDPTTKKVVRKEKYKEGVMQK